MNHRKAVNFAEAVQAVPVEMRDYLVAFAADLGAIDPVPGDPATAFLALLRGDLLGGQPGQATIIAAVGADRLRHYGRYRQAIDNLVAAARKNANLQRALKAPMRQFDELINLISGSMLQQNKRDAAAQAAFIGHLDSIARAIRRYQEHLAKLIEIDRSSAETVAAKKGKARGQYIDTQLGGSKATVADVIQLLTSRSQSGHASVGRVAERFLWMLAISDGWRITAGFHPSPTDKTTHVTVAIDGHDTQFHLRVSKGRVLFQITWGDERRGRPLEEYPE